MKKLLALFIAALMLLSLTACNLGDSLGQKDGDEVMMEYDQEEMQEKLDKLKNEKGVLIEMTVTSTETGEAPEVGTITYAENKDAFYFKSEEDEIMFDFSNPDKCVTYEKNTDGTWEKYDTVYAESGITREQMEASASLYTMALTGYLGNYSQFAGQMMTVTSDKVAGRNCDKFTYSMMFMGVGVEYTFCVDKETGMCLEWKMKAAAGMEGSATVEYTCTRFETPYTITFPKDAVDVTDGSGNNNNNNNNNDQSGELTKIPTPEVKISESGMASFMSLYGNGYRIKINGTEVASQSATNYQYQLQDGDTIQVMVVGDGSEYSDSDWSKTATYGAPDYDFSNLGLSQNTFDNLVAYTKMEPGVYNEGAAIFCENGDFIYKKESGSTWEYIFDADTYQFYTLTYRYTGKDNLTSDYALVNYTAEHKYDYYKALSGYTFSASFAWKKDDGSKVYADYQAYLMDVGYTILDKDTVCDSSEANYKKFELLDYTEYSNEIDYSLFNTTYLHSSRGTKGMYDSVKDKILTWKIERCNFYNFFKTSWFYTDYKLTLTFDETFTPEDAAKLAALLGAYGCVADEGYPLTIGDGYAYKGEIAVYDYPYSESHFDYMYDRYEISYIQPMEGLMFNSTLKVTYMNSEYDDAGTSHHILKDGLHKYFPREDSGYYDVILLKASGEKSDHPLPPEKSIGDFSAQMQYSYSSDEPGAWRDTYTFERVGDVFVTVRESEYGFDYTLIRRIGDKYYKRSGDLSKPSEWEPNPQIEWDEFEEAYDFFDYEFLDNISEYYRAYPKPEKGSSVTVAGKNCTRYTYTYDGTSHTYDVYDGNLTLKFIESYDGYTNTVEFTKFDAVNAFSADIQSLVTASGIGSYTPTAE